MRQNIKERTPMPTVQKKPRKKQIGYFYFKVFSDGSVHSSIKGSKVHMIAALADLLKEPQVSEMVSSAMAAKVFSHLNEHLLDAKLKQKGKAVG